MTFRFLKLGVVTILSVVGVSCAPVAPPPQPRPFVLVADSSEYQPFLVEGDGTITGQAFLTTRGGEVRLAAGRLVTLDPATRYAREWFRRFGADPSTFGDQPSDPLFRAARRVTTANAEGRFRFSGLPPGEYLLRTIVMWEAGSAGTQGGVVAAVARSSSTQSNEVILNTAFYPTTSGMLGLEFVEESALASRAHRELGVAKGISCQVGLIHSPPDEAAARADLLLNAARLGADAVTSVSCQRLGMSFSPNCVARIECAGRALLWT